MITDFEASRETIAAMPLDALKALWLLHVGPSVSTTGLNPYVGTTLEMRNESGICNMYDRLIREKEMYVDTSNAVTFQIVLGKKPTGKPWKS